MWNGTILYKHWCCTWSFILKHFKLVVWKLNNTLNTWTLEKSPDKEILESMESSLVCSFSSFLPDKSKCTTSPYFPNENSLVYVKNCRRNIKNHLKSCNIGDIASEGHLICYRAGVFSLFGDYTICPFHRYSLGIRWKKKSSCSHPSHSTTAKAEVGRSITLSMSRHLHTVYGYIVPIGSGIYICIVFV